MSGRPVRLLSAATIAAAASLLSVSAVSAGCYSGCGYAAPVAHYSAPVVYSYSYSAPVSYAAPCNPCGSASYGYASPMYVVNQGPAYTHPVTIAADPTPSYGYGYRRAYPYYADGGVRWHRRHWHHRGYGYRHHRFGYRHHGYRHGYRHHGPRYGAVVPGYRHGYRGYRGGMSYRGGISYRGGFGHRGWAGPRHRMGAIPPRHWGGAMHPRRMHGGQMHIMRNPGAVHPRQGGGMRKMP